MKLFTVPEISHFTEKEGFLLCKCVSGSELFMGEINPIDLESQDANEQYAKIFDAIKDLNEDELLRIKLERRFSSYKDNITARQKYIESRHFSEKKLFISLERPKSLLSIFSFTKGQNFTPRMLTDMGCQPSDNETYEKAFHFKGAKISTFVDVGNSVLGFIRVIKQGSRKVNVYSLFSSLQKIACEYDLQLTIKRPNPFIFKRTLSHLENEAKSAKVGEGGENAYQIEKITASARQLDEKPFSLEMILTIYASDERSLRDNLREANSALSEYLHTNIETYGTLKTFLHTFPGTDQHLCFLEFEGKLKAFLPIFTCGEPYKNGRKSSLAFERVDGSIYQFNPLKEGRVNSNMIVMGGSGIGKSALTNMISTALLNDPSVLMTKIDIGGSYRNECAILGGTELNFDQRTPSGLNPFQLISHVRDHEDSASILSNFLKCIMIEEGELNLPKGIAADLEMAVMKYIKSELEKLSIDGFINSGLDIPRLNILRRFQKGASYGNLFSGTHDFSKTRYLYFNFQNVSGVTDRDFAQSIYAAATACIYIRSMIKGAYEKSGLRQAVFVDEARACIEYSYQSFSYLTANMRKFGDLTLFAVQSSKHLLGPSLDGPSKDIITNSSIKFIREIDCAEEDFQNLLSLSNSELEILKAWRQESQAKTYRKFLLKEDANSKIAILRLTPEELYRVGTAPDEKAKVQKLVDQVGLSYEEAIRCLSYS